MTHWTDSHGNQCWASSRPGNDWACEDDFTPADTGDAEWHHFLSNMPHSIVGFIAWIIAWIFEAFWLAFVFAITLAVGGFFIWIIFQ